MQNLLFKKFERKVFTICVRYAGSREEAKDISQEVFIKLFQNLLRPDLTPIDSLERWVVRITINTAIDHYRKVLRLVQSRSETTPLAISETPAILHQLNEESLLDLLQTLPTLYRQVFNLHVIDGYSHKEISQLISIPESSSRTYLTRAREMMKEKIVQMGLEKKSAAL